MIDFILDHIGSTSILRPYHQLALNSNANYTNSRSNMTEPPSSTGGQLVEISRINSGSHNRNNSNNNNNSNSRASVSRQVSISTHELNTLTSGGAATSSSQQAVASSSHHHYNHHNHHHHHHFQPTPLKLPPVATPVATATSNGSSSNGGLLIGGSVNNINGISLSETLAAKKKQPTDLSRCCYFCKKKTGLASSYMCR